VVDIPELPRIPLSNYLLTLVDEKDCKGRSLYLVGAVEFVAELWKEIKSNRARLNVRELVPGELGIHYNSLYMYMNGKKAVSIELVQRLLELWKTTCRREESDVQERFNQLYQQNLPLIGRRGDRRTHLPLFITPRLCYLTGWIVGDGSLNEAHNYVLKITEESREQLSEILKPLITAEFGIYPPIFRVFGKGYAIQFGSKSIYRFMTRILQLKVGEIPSFIFSLDPICKKYFLMGVFDAEGCVHKDRHRVSIAQGDRDFLLKIQGMFKELGVKFYGPTLHTTRLGSWFTIQLSSKAGFVRFSKTIGSNHVKKEFLIQNWL
jgi:LAGLIDADG-like domain